MQSVAHYHNVPQCVMVSTNPSSVLVQRLLYAAASRLMMEYTAMKDDDFDIFYPEHVSQRYELLSR
jgi:hypothetical protein